MERKRDAERKAKGKGKDGAKGAGAKEVRTATRLSDTLGASLARTAPTAYPRYSHSHNPLHPLLPKQEEKKKEEGGDIIHGEGMAAAAKVILRSRSHRSRLPLTPPPRQISHPTSPVSPLR